VTHKDLYLPPPISNRLSCVGGNFWEPTGESLCVCVWLCVCVCAVCVCVCRQLLFSTFVGCLVRFGESPAGACSWKMASQLVQLGHFESYLLVATVMLPFKQELLWTILCQLLCTKGNYLLRYLKKLVDKVFHEMKSDIHTLQNIATRSTHCGWKLQGIKMWWPRTKTAV